MLKMSITAVNRSRLFALAWTVFWAAGMTILLFASVQLSDGRLIYTIDDPLIHLAVAENILAGGYGVNAGQFSSPSSSVLYPLLLALTLALGLGILGPLVINLLAAGASVWLLLEFFGRQAVPETAPRWPLFANVCAPLLILSINAFALPLTGMEHCLHVLAVIVTMRGLVAVAERGQVSVWLIVAVVALPLIRFEGVALAIAAIAVLAVTGQVRPALLTGVAIVVAFGAYGLVMHGLGLPLLPSSVLAKSDIAANLQGQSAAGVLTGLISNLWNSLTNRWGVVFALAVCALLIAAQDKNGRWRALRTPEFLIGGTMVVGLGAHLAAARYDQFFRYEVYAVAILIAGGAYLLRPLLVRISDQRLFAAPVGLVAALFVVVLPYLTATFVTPLASQNIYEQQFQMHRFATEYFPRRVAVNDLGWVSYDNDTFVLDLRGLGSETARQLWAAGRLDANAITDLVEKAGVDFAMVYDELLGAAIPDSWCRMAILRTGHLSAGSGEVVFYATRPSAVADMRAALERFAPTLPARVGFRIAPCAGS